MAEIDVFSDALKEFIGPLEKRLKVPTGFFKELLKDPSDWSFILKLCALVEVAVAHRLASKLRKPELQDTFSRLDLASQNTGQVAFLKALGLLDNQRNFIYALAGIRNDYAHDIYNVSLRFEDYFEKSKKGKDRLKNLKAAIRKAFKSDDAEALERVVNKTPRFVVWLLGMVLLIEIYKGLLSSSLLAQMLASRDK